LGVTSVGHSYILKSPGILDFSLTSLKHKTINITLYLYEAVTHYKLNKFKFLNSMTSKIAHLSFQQITT